MLQVQRHYCSQQVIELWQLSVGGTYIPDRTLVIFEHQNQRIDKFGVVQKTDRRALKALNFKNGICGRVFGINPLLWNFFKYYYVLLLLEMIEKWIQPDRPFNNFTAGKSVDSVW